MEQLSFFEQDIRTDKQQSKRVAYDVGEKIGGARKDEAALKKAFEESQTLTNLANLESVSATLAAEVVQKKHLFIFSLEHEQQKGTEPTVARLKQLLLQRIDTVPAVDSPAGRKKYLQAAKYYQEVMDSVRSFEEFKNVYRTLSKKIHHELTPIDYLERKVKELEQKGSDDRELEDCRKLLNEMEEAQHIPLHCLGEKFTNFFTKSKSANTTVRKVLESIQSWDDLNKSSKRKTTAKKSNDSWERPIPENPQRVSERYVSIQRPEELMDLFGFRGIQFGHYVEDAVAMEHLKRSTEAFMDLGDVLGIDDFSLSLDGHLGMAYGARGRGKALGTYDPSQKVINLTKNRGLIGVLAHEWFHALDHHVYCASHEFQNGQVGYATDGQLGPQIPSSVWIAFIDLMESIKEGKTIAFMENQNQAGTRWNVDMTFKRRYERCCGDLYEIMKEYQETLVQRMEERLTFFRDYYRMEPEKEKAKLFRDTQKKLRQYGQALAWYHEQQTGIRVKQIPYPSNRSVFFQNAIELDKGREGKYWSSNRELAARAFEQYVYFKIEEKGYRNDYLVFSPFHSMAYPSDDERVAIFRQFDELFKVLKCHSILKRSTTDREGKGIE